MRPLPFAILALTFAAPLLAQPAGRVVLDTIPAPALEGNLLGDPARQPAYVYLPPGYDAEPHRRYPTIYLLHGILDGPRVWVEPVYQGMTVRATMDSLIAAGEIGPSIVVMPNGRNAYGASGWRNSEVAGRWGDYVARDVVAGIDRAYRTIPRPESRAIAGHSMGGFGAIDLAMRHPDVFSVTWGMNPCCLCCLGVDTAVELEMWERMRAYPSIEAMWADLEERGDPWPLLLAGVWSLFLPDPDAPPFYYDPPVRREGDRLVPVPGAVERIESQLLLARIADHAEALRSLRGLAFDNAFDDEFAHIPIGTKALSDSLEALEVPHVYEVYDGDHRNRMRERMAAVILPWIDERLARETGGAADDRVHLEIEPVELTTREGPEVTVAAEEGFLEVPERWDDPDGGTIRLHFYRYPSTAEEPGAPVVYLAGGPGGSGSISSLGDRFGLFQAMRAVGDVIAFDQRGVYGSEPYLLCPNSWNFPLEEAGTHAAAVEVLSSWSRECAEHWEGEGVDLSAYHTRASVADLEALREAVGAERLNLWGISYGTHLGLAYLREHPDRVHRAVLAGIEGPDHTVKLPSNWERAVAAFDSAAAADPSARAAFGRVRPMIDRLAARFDPPRVVATGDGREVTIGRVDVLSALLDQLSEREDYVELPLRIHRILEGAESDLAESIAGDRSGGRGLAMSLVVDCASGASPERLARVREEAGVSWLGEATLSLIPDVCAAWPHTDLGPDFRAPIESEVPVLFVSGTLDARTPVANAVETLAGFPNGDHLVIEGAGHDDDLFLSDPAIAEAMIGFLESGEEPPARVTLPPLEFQVP